MSGTGLVVVSSAFGVTAGLQATIDGYTARGFIVRAPDMFRRTTPGPLGQSDADRALMRARLEAFDLDEGVADIRAAIDELRAQPECNGKVAVLGYCFGGELAYLAVTRLGAAAAVAFHGVNIGKHLDEAGHVHVPMSLHFGGDDRFVPPDEVSAIEAAFRTHPDVGVFTYPGAKHGFAQPEAAVYDEAATRLAEARARAVLEAL